ncbi:MAG: hypothetical protein JSW29_06245 [Candidatus Bathyarchaeota archaeon]|nr:MAG: hypothetical protein JSW29_06245 [Candidatus Bathyarchaeota archaeon]
MKEDAKLCDSCGTPVIAEAKIRRRTRYTKEREACFGPPGSGGGLWGAISFGVFVVGLGILWLFDIFWPGILILIGIMVIIGAFVTLSRR